MEEVARKGQEGMKLLPELAKQAAIMGNLGNLYVERYLNKTYRVLQQTGLQWVMECYDRPRYFYKMFRMGTDVFMALHDLLVSAYGLTSTTNVSSIESLVMFLLRGPRTLSQGKNIFSYVHFGHFIPSLWKYQYVCASSRKVSSQDIQTFVVSMKWL